MFDVNRNDFITVRSLKTGALGFNAYFFQDTVSLDHIDLFNMLNETKSDLEILSCKFMNQGCKDEWVDIVTVYGV